MTSVRKKRVYAIGLGTAEKINPATLEALTNDTGGYMLMTGDLGGDDFFRLAKYYLQIVAGVTNAEIVLDPEGWIAPGQTHRIPFNLNEADISADIILLSSNPTMIDFFLETPDGQIINPNVASANPVMQHVLVDNVSYYRITLPIMLSSFKSKLIDLKILKVHKKAHLLKSSNYY